MNAKCPGLSNTVSHREDSCDIPRATIKSLKPFSKSFNSTTAQLTMPASLIKSVPYANCSCPQLSLIHCSLSS